MMEEVASQEGKRLRVVYGTQVVDYSSEMVDIDDKSTKI